MSNTLKVVEFCDKIIIKNIDENNVKLLNNDICKFVFENEWHIPYDVSVKNIPSINRLEVLLKDGTIDIYDSDESNWTDYFYNENRNIIVVKDDHGRWIGIYNMDEVISVRLK